MVRTGVDNPWRPDEDPERQPEPLDEWLSAGFAKEDAEVWRNWRFRIGTAAAWRDAGVVDGLRAAQWSTAGVTPDTVNQWRAAGIDATEAVTWHELGFSFAEARRHKQAGRSPGQAFDNGTRSASVSATSAASGSIVSGVARSGLGRAGAPPHLQRFLDAGVDPRVIHSYMSRQWTDDEAVGWARQGIDAAEARIWMILGLEPSEAARLERQGLSVAETLRQWWRTGIPIEEVGHWIGAGLKPDEAVDQRARGVTAEQAATLRALRDEAS
jgi:hypothetical protein